MTPDEVRQIVLQEIGRKWSLTNLHGVDLGRCLVDPPRKKAYTDSFTSSVRELWLVLEEDPDSHSGYSIVFDETVASFGLATPGLELPVFIGLYGTFLETLEGM